MRFSWWQPFLWLAAILPFSSSSRYDDPNVYLECPYPYVLVGDTCLFSLDDCTDTKSYINAQAYCQSQVGGGHLATFTTACQYEGIVKYIEEFHGGDGCSFWVGATDDPDEGVFRVDNSYGEIQPIDGPFFDSTGTISNVQGTDNLIFASDSFYRIIHDDGTTLRSYICQTYPKEVRSHSHYPPVYFFPAPADSSSTDAAGGGGGGGGGGTVGDTSTVNVDGDNFSSDNTASFSSMPQITVNTHHHHVEKHPKVIIIPTYNTPPHHSQPHNSHTGSTHGGYGHRAFNDSHISVSYEPHVDHEPHVDTPEHMLIDGSLHPNGIANYLTQKRTQSENSPKKPSGPVSTIKKLLKSGPPQLKNLTSSEDFLKRHTKAELLKARTTFRVPATQDVQRQDLISQLLHLIDQVGQEVPYKSIGNVHTESLQSKRLFNKKTKIADEVFQSESNGKRQRS